MSAIDQTILAYGGDPSFRPEHILLMLALIIGAISACAIWEIW